MFGQDAIPLFKLFYHFAETDTPMNDHYTYWLTSQLSAIDAFCGREKIDVYAIGFPTFFLRDRASVALFVFAGKK